MTLATSLTQIDTNELLCVRRPEAESLFGANRLNREAKKLNLCKNAPY